MGAARETLSPLIKNIQTRRLSLELCQKIGSQLLSPNKNGGVSAISELKFSPVSKNNFQRSFLNTNFQQQLSSSSVSPNSGKSNNNINGRRGSDSFADLKKSSSPIYFGKSGVRRGSLTPLASSNGERSHIFPSQIYSIPTISIEEALSPPSSDKENPNKENEDISPKIIKKNILSPFSESVFLKLFDQIENKSSSISTVFSSVSPSPTSSISTSSPSSVEELFYNKRQTLHQKYQKYNFSPSTSTNRLNYNNKPLRRRSLHSHRDIDEEFVSFVNKRCNLFIYPQEILGRGSFGTVVVGIYHGRSVAVKVISTKSVKHLESMKGEQNALGLPPHPNIAKIIDIFQFGPERALVIMERLLKGNLLTILNNTNIPIDSITKVKFCIDISSALCFCHSKGFLHLDVKPQNILLDAGNNCKLTDFGNSKKVAELAYGKKYNQVDGTVAYKAPELFRGHRPNEKSDVYSLAISMWQIQSREFPYPGENEHSIIYKVVAQDLRPLPLTAMNLNGSSSSESEMISNYANLYQICWHPDQNRRPDMKTILKSLQRMQKFFSA